MSRLLLLYPRRWRDRYGHEIAALLEERAPSSEDRLDLVRGAIDAWLHPGLVDPAKGPGPDPVSPFGRRAGWVSLGGAVTWMVAMIVALNGPVVRESWGTYRDGGTALPLVIVAMALLVVGIAATAGRLPPRARVGRAAAWVFGGAGLLWSMAPWIMATGAVAALAFAVVALAAVRSGQWPAWLMGPVAVAVLAYPLVATGLVELGSASPDTQFVLLGALVVLWLAVAGPLLSAPRTGAGATD